MDDLTYEIITNCRKATQIDQIDPVSFAANLPSAQQVLLSTPGEEAKQMANKLYAAAHASKRPLPKVDRKKTSLSTLARSLEALDAGQRPAYGWQSTGMEHSVQLWMK